MGGQIEFYIIVLRLTPGVFGMLRPGQMMAQVVLRLCSGMLRCAQACSGAAYLRLRYVYPQHKLQQHSLTIRGLKRNLQKRKLILSLWVFCDSTRHIKIWPHQLRAAWHTSKKMKPQIIKFGFLDIYSVSNKTEFFSCDQFEEI
jgi:hypothetical protein